MLLVCAMAAASVVYSSTVGPAPSASAATVTLGTVQGQLANHAGVDNGTTGNCIRYSPASTSTSSGVVSAPNEALTAHGRPGQNTSTCPPNLSTSSQSAVGFRPSSVSSVTDGAPFLIGRMVHYNNPVYADDRYFTGDLRATLTGFASPNTLTFPWTLDETPNTGTGNCCNDLLAFTNQISERHAVAGRSHLQARHARIHRHGDVGDLPRDAGRHAAEHLLDRRGRADARVHVCGHRAGAFAHAS